MQVGVPDKRMQDVGITKCARGWRAQHTFSYPRTTSIQSYRPPHSVRHRSGGIARSVSTSGASAGSRNTSCRIASPPSPGARLPPPRVIVSRCRPALSSTRNGVIVSGLCGLPLSCPAIDASARPSTLTLTAGISSPRSHTYHAPARGSSKRRAQLAGPRHFESRVCVSPRRVPRVSDVHFHYFRWPRRDQLPATGCGDPHHALDARASHRSHARQAEMGDRRAAPRLVVPTPGSRCPARPAGTRPADARRGSRRVTISG